MNVKALGEAQYINLETFKKNRQGVKTPVWVAGENGRLYVWTQADSWKVKRIKKCEDVNLCQSDARGTPQSDWYPAKAQVLTSDDAKQANHRRMLAKYGLLFRLFALFGRLRGQKLEDYATIEIKLV